MYIHSKLEVSFEAVNRFLFSIYVLHNKVVSKTVWITKHVFRSLDKKNCFKSNFDMVDLQN